MASLAHFNWFTAIYVNCIYFTLWKTYDIFWFWIHLLLCIFFPLLRSQNFILVFFNLLKKKCTEYSDKSFKEIYEILYRNSDHLYGHEEIDENDGDQCPQNNIRAINKQEAERLYPKLDEKEITPASKNEHKILIAQQKAIRRERNRTERRRKTVADAVNLLLTVIHDFLPIGSIHKIFIPRYLADPIDNYDDPYLLTLFTITMSIDVLMFWMMILWTYLKQLRLCCRLGFCRFLLWLITLGILAVVIMYIPMHTLHEQLDPTWCVFEEGQPLSEYFDGK